MKLKVGIHIIKGIDLLQGFEEIRMKVFCWENFSPR